MKLKITTPLTRRLLLLAICFLPGLVSGQTTQLHQDSFEGSTTWVLVGATLTTGNAYNGTSKIQVPVNGSNMTSPVISTAGYNKVDVSFFVRGNSLSTNDRITLQYRDNPVAAWTTVRTVDKGVAATIRDVNDNTNYYALIGTIFSTSSTFAATAQFRFVTTTGSASRQFFIDYVTVTGTVNNTIATGPGGITANLETWLRADQVNGSTVGTDGANVNIWTDRGKGNDAKVIDATNATLTNRPVYRNNTTKNINFNPVVEFGNNPSTSASNYTYLSNRAELQGTSGFYSHDLFIVVINDNPATITSTTASVDLYCAQSSATSTYEKDGTGIGFGQYSIRFDNEVVSYCVGSTPEASTPDVNERGYGLAQVNGTYSSVNIINSRHNSAATKQELYSNALSISNTEVGVPQWISLANRRYWLGRSQVFDGSFGGRIAEVISYSARKNDATERNRIESYLAIKYGITLGTNGVSQNYVNSAGTTIWNIAPTGFNYDIAGIGRDDSAQLNQKQSKSINSGAVITMGLGNILTTNSANTNTFDADRKYLVWGSNGQAMTTSATPLTVTFGPSTVTTSTDITNKKWKVVETGGDVATVKVSLATTDLASLPALSGNDAYVMIIASDAAFTTGIDMVFLNTNGTNQECFYDFDGTKYIAFGVAHEVVLPRHITIDGVDDAVKVDNKNDLTGAFTIMGWARPTGANNATNDKTIVSKHNGTTGYRLVIQNDNKIRMEWNGNSLISNTTLPNNIWHNIAAVYNSGTLSLYIDGVLDRSGSMPAPTATTSIFTIGAEYRNKSSIVNIFKGDLDELRIWSRALTLTELRYIMNQEIMSSGANTLGRIMPSTVTKNDVSALTWASLTAYYSMNTYIGTHINDNSLNKNRGNLVNPSKIDINTQTAPMPYDSNATGLWSATATWLNGTTQDLPYSLSIVDGTTPIDWNIVRTAHNVTSSGNKTLLGLFVNSNTLFATNDSKVEVSHFLRINGKIDLQGRSQLVQTYNSDLDPTSSGSIERDQQGQSNRFNYNYWSSPVGAINATTNNNNYTVSGVLRDGTNAAAPATINWIGGYDGSATTPISLARYWIYKFQNLSDLYANWTQINETGILTPSSGFTMKGSNAGTATQNYVFVGKPYNGRITNAISANNINLSGNPYASALDAQQFINDNSAVINGAIYFWEHYPTNNTHVLQQYQGGYATRNLSGGTPPVSPPGISGLGSSSRVPGRFIPVGQGFFLHAGAAGGTLVFDNNQRAFVKEDAATSNVMFRNTTVANNAMVTNDHFNNNGNDPISEDSNSRIRLGFTSAVGNHRQILLAFMDGLATDDWDYGYDGIVIDDDLPQDMLFHLGDKKLVIQGVGHFNDASFYPLYVKTDVAGIVKFKIDALENFNPDQPVYIHNNITNSYYDIRNSDYEVAIPAGENYNFTLCFETKRLSVTENVLESVNVAYLQGNNQIRIQNKLTDVSVGSVSLYNVLGQQLNSWRTATMEQQEIVLPVNNVSTGTYIVKVDTNKGSISKKIIIK
ncbi:LamG-like jellyroll fold domain-containing protein [Flavobacterium cerinum]|uniref:T9SS type A sorting domain-containing protein n=1 Tax=Flavobacterium cerinum TaxID=2502784 RepID=A0ABY5IRZ0_9FLAO|nr:LamG-like jellyroll fold domain-containing protein [Flavobacterium cerinum]UUC45549.1 T9SS type A sorting domain-containing protein [Flavobacterium cerinum]